MDDFGVELGLEQRDDARWSLPVVPRLCAGDGRLFGGVLAAAASVVSERQAQRRISTLHTQFVAGVDVGESVVLECRIRAERRALTVVETSCTSTRGTVATCAAVLVEVGAGETVSTFGARPPSAPSPDECPPREYRWPDPASISSLVDVRVARPAGASGRALLWGRLRGIELQSAPTVALLADHVAFATRTGLGVDDVRTLDHCVRLTGATGGEWILMDLALESVAAGIVHGHVRLWSADGVLLATSDQTVFARQR